MLQIANGGPALPENRILDGGFLEWVRWFDQPEKRFGELGYGARLTKQISTQFEHRLGDLSA